MFSFPRATAEDTSSTVAEEILSLIPTDTYEQLDLAPPWQSHPQCPRWRSISHTLLGFIVREFEDFVLLKVKLSKERDSLAITANKLSRDLSKRQRAKGALPFYDGISASTHSSNGLKGMGNTFDEGPRDHSAVQTPQRSSASTSPRKPSYDGRTSLSSWYPSSQPSSGANSPPHGHSLPVRTPRIDGKEFFRRVRSHLSYEQFSAFLANIKELNAQKQTREGTDEVRCMSSFGSR
ncbi:hypothetical protein V6N13_121445 [Hibiscus sabdariffa]